LNLNPSSPTEYVEHGSSAPGPRDAQAQAKRSKRVRPGWTKRGLTQRSMIVFYSKTEKGLKFDKSRKDETVWPELVKQRLDMTKVNKRWLDKYKKEQGLK